ncbi:MAG: HD domain-containing protein [Acidobacteriota bacterium]
MFSADRYVTALRFAAGRHHGQLVPGSELPYVVHVTSVAAEVLAAIAVDAVGDPDLAVACALLHDTIEDTPTTRDELAREFGTAVADGVLALTKDKRHADPMADSLSRIQAQPREVWIVKLADRITNLATPPRQWTKDKCRAYRAEGLAIADALGRACAALDARLRARADAYAAFC